MFFRPGKTLIQTRSLTGPKTKGVKNESSTGSEEEVSENGQSSKEGIR